MKNNDETRRADHLANIVRWLIQQIDIIFYALCPEQIGTWQQRAIMAAQKARELAKLQPTTPIPAKVRAKGGSGLTGGRKRK